MVHFPPLPGSPQYDAKRGVQWLVDSCAADIEHLQAGGVDASCSAMKATGPIS
jgi:predicted TIM-barrel enzyme